MTVLLALISGALVGFVLAVVGGGGSILAVPLLVHVVGVPSPHVALGTSAVAVAVNAFASLYAHAKQGVIKWRCAALFSLSGMAGASLGAALGKALNGEKLLSLFGALMLLVGVAMLRPRKGVGQPSVRLTLSSARVLAPRLIALGFATGAVSGFFGIGGGFLIVPSLLLATDMPLSMAVSSSLVAVSLFGATTALSYAASGLVDWELALIFSLGGVAGSQVGTRVAMHLAKRSRRLATGFALTVILVGSYVLAQGLRAAP